MLPLLPMQAQISPSSTTWQLASRPTRTPSSSLTLHSNHTRLPKSRAMSTRQPPPTSKMHTPPLPPSFTPRSSSSVSTETPRRRNNETIATPRSMTIAQSPKLQAFYEHIMSPLETSPGSDPRFRRRGRQPTACTECNRRKQRVRQLQVEQADGSAME